MNKKMSKKKKIVIAIAAIVILSSVFGSNEDSAKPINTIPIVSEPVATPEEVVVKPVATPIEIEVPVYTFEKDGKALAIGDLKIEKGTEIIVEGVLTVGNTTKEQESKGVAMHFRKDEELYAIDFNMIDKQEAKGYLVGDFVRIKGFVVNQDIFVLYLQECTIIK